MTGETTGWGTEFWLHDGSNLVELVGVFDLAPPEEETADVEITHYKSPARSREYIRGMIERGEFQVQMNYVPGNATDALCRDARDEGDTRAWKIVLPDDAGDPAWEITGNGYAKGYARAIPLDDRLTATLTMKVSGAPSEAAPA